MGRALVPASRVRNDLIQTPLEYARAIVRHFSPTGKVLEPCKGSGNFVRALEEYGKCEIEWCEITEGRDFLSYSGKVDWIITNPPFSKMREFLNKSMEVADNVVFLTTINHLWLKARIRDIERNGFGIKEIVIFDTPPGFPQSGFQVGCFHLKRGYVGDIKFGRLIIGARPPVQQALSPFLK